MLIRLSRIIPVLILGLVAMYFAAKHRSQQPIKLTIYDLPVMPLMNPKKVARVEDIYWRARLSMQKKEVRNAYLCAYKIDQISDSSDYKQGRAYSHYLKGLVLYENKNYDSALYHQKRALLIQQDSIAEEDSWQMCYILSDLAKVYEKLGNQEQADICLLRRKGYMLGIWVRDFKELEEKKAKKKKTKIHKEQEERDIIETLPRNLRLLYTKSELTEEKNIYQSLFYANEVIIKSLDQGIRNGFLLGKFRVSGLIGYLYLSYGDFERAKNHAKRQLFMATEQLDDKRSIRDAFDLFSDIIIKCMSVNEEQAIDYAGLMIKEGKKVGDKSAEALGYYQKGYVYDEHLSNYVDALINYFKSLEINQEIGNNQGISCSYLRIGVVYYKLEMYDRALSYYQQFLKNAQAIDNKSDEAVAYRSIALVYRQLNQNVDQVILYYKKSLLVREELKDSIGMADCYNGIANAYYTLTDDFQQAKNYYLQAASIFKLYDKEQELVDVYYNLGLLYKKHNEKVEATGYFQKSISLAKEIGYQQAIIDGNIQLGISQSEAKIYKSAITNLSEAKLIARKQKSIKSLIEINQLLSETYEKIHNTNEALIALKESRKYGELYTTQQYQENKELDNQRASVTSWEIKIKKSKEDTGTSTYQWLFFSLIGLITLVAGTVALYHTKVFGIASFAGVGNKNKKQTEKILLTELTELKEQVNQVLNNNQAQYSDQIKQEAQAIYTKIQEIKTHQQHISKRGISKRKLKELWDILQNSQAFLALANQQKGNYNQTDHS